MERLLGRTDWLNSQPLFFNTQTCKASTNVNDVIVRSRIEFDTAGLTDYLDFGYSVFGHTPVRHVRFLPPCTELWLTSEGKLRTQPTPDPVDAWMGRTTHPADIIEQFRHLVQTWARSEPGRIVLPLSGGFDSRWLAWTLARESGVHAYSYGFSHRQSDCFEVRYAQRVCQILSIPWERVELGGFHQFVDDWSNLFGVSTHTHGMYQIEFFRKLLTPDTTPGRVISGIVGDAFAGSYVGRSVSGPHDLLKIGYSHGLHADSSRLRGGASYVHREDFWHRYRSQLNSLFFQTATMVRMKMILLCYLLKVPSSLGFDVWSPFTDPSISLGMLALPQEQRANRLWQRRLFESEGLLVEREGMRVMKSNCLNLLAMRTFPLRPLDVTLLEELFDTDYVEWINREMARSGCFRTIAEHLRYRLDLAEHINRFGLRDRKLQAYYAYLTLKPIEDLLRDRKE
jgi:hypothetical protein